MSMLNWIRKKTHREDKAGLKDIAKHLMKGDYEVMVSLTKLIQTTIFENDVQGNVMIAETFMGRVEMIGEHFPVDAFLQLIDPVDDLLGKNEVLSGMLKKKGDKFRKRVNYTHAIKSYNLAACFAPINTKKAGKIYWKRSTVLLTINNYEGSIHDTEAALNYQCSKKLELKLIKRHMKSVRMNKPVNDQEELYRQNYLKTELFKIHGGTNTEIPLMADYINILPGEGKEKHVTVDIGIETGTTMMLEDPFVSLPLNALNWEMKYCAHCYKKLKSVIACPGCTFVTYCSSSCQEKDHQDGHRHECPLLPYFHATNVDRNMHLSLKALCKAGPKLLHDLYLSSITEPEWESTKCFRIIDDCGKLHPYSHILNLTSRIPTAQMPTLTWMAMSVVHVLDQKSSFFDEIEESERGSFINFVSSILLKHVVSFPLNTSSIYDEKKNRDMTPDSHSMKFHSQEYTQIGSGIYPLTDMLNHSCDPTVLREQLPNGRIAIISNRQLNPGDELLLSYGCVFSTSVTNARQNHLSQNFDFICNCIACKRQWPRLDQILKDGMKYLCPTCKVEFVFSRRSEVHKCVLIASAGFGVCGNCEESFEMDVLKQHIVHHEIMMEQADELVFDNKALEAIQILKDCISFFQVALCPPSSQMIISQALLDEAYNLLIFPKK